MSRVLVISTQVQPVSLHTRLSPLGASALAGLLAVGASGCDDEEKNPICEGNTPPPVTPAAPTGATADAGLIRRAAGECLKRVTLDRRIRLLGVRAGALIPLSQAPSVPSLPDPEPLELFAKP